MIYFVREPAADLVKIGFSADPWRRLTKMQSDSATLLEIAALMEGGRADEAALHRRFSSALVRGEWFRWAGEVATFATALPTVLRPVSARRAGARTQRIQELSKATGQPFNTVRCWVPKDAQERIPSWYWMAIERAGLGTVRDLAIAEENRRIGQSRAAA